MIFLNQGKLLLSKCSKINGGGIMKMKMSTENMAKIGGAAMAIGAAAAITAGVVNSKSTKSKMKKLAKKSVKTIDNIVDSVNSMVK